jgi:hypothetical protein
MNRMLPSRTCSLVEVYNVSEKHNVSIFICSDYLAQFSALKMEAHVPPKHP